MGRGQRDVGAIVLAVIENAARVGVVELVEGPAGEPAAEHQRGGQRRHVVVFRKRTWVDIQAIPAAAALVASMQLNADAFEG